MQLFAHFERDLSWLFLRSQNFTFERCIINPKTVETSKSLTYKKLFETDRKNSYEKLINDKRKMQFILEALNL